MPRFHNINGNKVQFTEAEETARDAEEAQADINQQAFNDAETAAANKNFKPGFAASMIVKDLSLAQSAAASVNLNTPLGSLALDMYKDFIKKGNGGLDYSAIIKLIEDN